MAEKSIIIIGAGLGGLSTGCYAQMNGYNSQIFEHHTKPGGVCTSWKKNGYMIDGCIHWLMGSKPDSSFYKIYREVGALEGNRLIYISHYGRFIDEATGQCLDVTSDLDRLAADMKSLSPEDGKIIEEIVEESRALKGYALDAPKPKELMGLLDGLKMMWQMRGFLKYAIHYKMSVVTFAERIHSPILRQMINNLFLPEMPVAFLFVLLGQLANGELAILEGGSRKFSFAIAKRYKNLGGKITYGATVEEILVENNRAIGVRLANGSEHMADIVVSAADGYSTIFKMLKGRYINNKIRDRYSKWPLFRPILLISFGVARQFRGEPSENMFFLQNPFSISDKQVKSFSFRIFNYNSMMAPGGKAVVQAIVETDFNWWNELQKDRPHYEAEKERVATEVLSRLEVLSPGITSQVEMTDVATPYTFWRYTRNYRGAFEGWLMTPETMFAQVEKTLPGLKNFYMAGQWVEPGGGIPPALYSGRNLVQILCHRDKKRFSTTIP